MRMMLAVVGLALSVTAVNAQDPVKTREDLMNQNNKNGKLLSLMARGRQPFDAAKVNAALDQYADTAKQLPNLFPDNAKTGGDNRASPKIWENKADFNAKVAEFGKVVAEVKPKMQTLAGLKANLRVLAKTCDGCHDTYRLAKK